MPRHSIILQAARSLLSPLASRALAVAKPAPPPATTSDPTAPAITRRTPAPCPDTSLPLGRDTTCCHLTFNKHRQANDIAVSAGFAFNPTTKRYECPLLRTEPDQELQRTKLQETAVLIGSLLHAHSKAVRGAEVAAYSLLNTCPFNLAISANDGRIRITPPPDPDAAAALKALGGHPVHSKHRPTYFSFPPPGANIRPFVDAVTAIDRSIAPPLRTKNDPPFFVGPGLATHNRGPFLVLQMPPAGVTNDTLINYTLSLLSPRATSPGHYVVRTDTRPPAELLALLKTIADRQAAALVPPTTTTNGVFVDDRALRELLACHPADITLAPRTAATAKDLAAQITNHFGSLKGLGAAPLASELLAFQHRQLLEIATTLDIALSPPDPAVQPRDLPLAPTR